MANVVELNSHRAYAGRRHRPAHLQRDLLGAITIGLCLGIGGNWIFHNQSQAKAIWTNASRQIADIEIVRAMSTQRYGLCNEAVIAQNCVIDGDTFYHGWQKVRIADIDAPETHPSRCAYEERLGRRATKRLAELLSAAPIELISLADRDVDKFGRELRIVRRDGRSIGTMLVRDGLARPWRGRRQPWCT